MTTLWGTAGYCWISEPNMRDVPPLVTVGPESPAAVAATLAAVRAGLAGLAATARPATHPSTLHVHDANCWGDDVLVDGVHGPGRVCEEQARFDTRYDDDGKPTRWDDHAWYPLAVVVRTWPEGGAA